MVEIKDYLPSLVIWEITLKCNLKCLHCGSSGGKARINELSTKESLKLCKDLAELGFKGIALVGGEPFLRKDWYVLAKKIKDLGMKLSIVSNGFVDGKKIVPELTKLEADSVQISLDGASSQLHDSIRGVNGSFKKAVEFLRLSKNAGLSTGAITTISKMNFNELLDLKKFIINERIDWQIQEAVPIGRFPKKMVLSELEYYALGLFIAFNQKKYSSEGIFIRGPHNLGFHSRLIPRLGSYPEWKGCWAGRTVLGIQSNGNVKGCLALSDDFIEGNVRKRNIIDIWNDPNAFEFNRKFKKQDLGKNCTGCKYGEICKGGCTTRSNILTGKLHNDCHCYYRIENSHLIKK